MKTKTLSSIWVLGVLLMGFVTLSVLAAPVGADSDEPKARKTREHRQRGSREFQIVTVSTRNDMISGGDVLMRIDVSPRVTSHASLVRMSVRGKAARDIQTCCRKSESLGAEDTGTTAIASTLSTPGAARKRSIASSSRVPGARCTT